MKFECDAEVFSNAFKIVYENIEEQKEKSVDTQIYESIKICANNDVITLNSDSDNASVFVDINTSVFEDGEVYFNAKILKEYFFNVKGRLFFETNKTNEILKISNNEETMIEINLINGKKRNHLNLLVENPVDIKINAPEFKRMLKQTLFIIQNVSKQNQLKNLYFKVENTSDFLIFSIDSSRMSFTKTIIPNINKDGICVVHYKAAKLIYEAIPDENSSDVIIKYNSSNLYVEVKNVKIRVILVKPDANKIFLFDNYKNYQNINTKTKIKFKKQSMNNALSLVDKISKEEKLSYANFLTNGDDLMISIKSNMIKGYKDKIPVTLEGKDLNFCVNRSFIEDFLKNVKEENIVLYAESNIKIMQLRALKNDKEDDEFIYVFLPIKTSGLDI